MCITLYFLLLFTMYQYKFICINEFMTSSNNIILDKIYILMNESVCLIFLNFFLLLSGSSKSPSSSGQLSVKLPITCILSRSFTLSCMILDLERKERVWIWVTNSLTLLGDLCRTASICSGLSSWLSGDEHLSSDGTFGLTSSSDITL